MTDTPQPTTPASPILPAPVDLIDIAQLNIDLAIDKADIDRSLIDQPGFIVHYGVKHAQAVAQTAAFKRLRDNYAAQLDASVRQQIVDRGEKPTEARVAALLDAHPTMKVIHKHVIQAGKIEGIAEAAVYGFRHRKDMLVALGNNLRQERAGEITIRTEEAVAASRAQREAAIANRVSQ